MQRSAGLLQLKADIRFGGGLDGGDGRIRQGRQGGWREKRLLAGKAAAECLGILFRGKNR